MIFGLGLVFESVLGYSVCTAVEVYIGSRLGFSG